MRMLQEYAKASQYLHSALSIKPFSAVSTVGMGMAKVDDTDA